MNEGKRWESNFRESMGVGCIRLYDTTNGFVGVNNPCDFIFFKYPYQYLFELKSVENNLLPLTGTTLRQINDMYEIMQTGEGILGGICVQFREVRKAYFIPVPHLKYELDKGLKSISLEYCETRAGEELIEIPLEYKKVNCSVDKREFLLRLGYLMFHIRWGESVDGKTSIN